MVTTSNNKVMNLKNKDDEMVSYFLGIDTRVRMRYRKTSVKGKAMAILAYRDQGDYLSPYMDFLRLAYKGRV